MIDKLINDFLDFLDSEFGNEYEFRFVRIDKEIRFRVDFKNNKTYCRFFEIDEEITIDDLKNDFIKNKILWTKNI